VIFPIYDLETARAGILKRGGPDEYTLSEQALARNQQIFGQPLLPEAAVQRILSSVRTEGDSALLDWTERIDGIRLSQIRIPADEIHDALAQVDESIVAALQLSVQRVRAFHQRQKDRLQDWQVDGLGQIYRPIQRVGAYVPGGTAPLPSSLIMTVVPAQVAGVHKVMVCTPPDKTGSVPNIILATAALCGVTEVYCIGGAQAVGAMAYGTDTIPPVDKIVGPGNLYVTLAKRQVYGVVGIDGLPGPTETMVIADEFANPAYVAADLLAQAEHDVLASAILVTPSQSLAENVARNIGHQLETLSRADIITQSLSTRGGAVIVADLAEAFSVANVYGAEHLCLALENAASWVDSVQNAGGVFVGEHSFEVLGDYIAGPSHVMPTSGTARFASPLNIFDFIKVVSIISLDAESAAGLNLVAARLAHTESLTAHANSAEIRHKTR
jgi:histidinol dehydrogenase